MSKRCKIPTDEQKIVNALKRTLVEMQDIPDDQERDQIEREREYNESCKCKG